MERDDHLILLTRIALWPLAWWFNRRYSKPRSPGDLVFDPPMRYGLLAFGLVVLCFGLFMFLNPPGAAAIWPWMLTPLMSRVIGGWIMFLGVGGIVIFFEPRYTAYRALIPGTIVWDVALLIGSLLHLDNFFFDRTSAWVWFITLVLFTLGNIGALALYEPLYRRRAQGPAAAATS